MIKLCGSRSYWEACEEVRKKVANGCGPAGWKGKLVPDTIWGLNIEPACEIHDWDYAEGETIEEKEKADRTFLNNMLRLIEDGSRWLKWLRRSRAIKYYSAVVDFGGPAYWACKNSKGEMGNK